MTHIIFVLFLLLISDHGSLYVYPIQHFFHILCIYFKHYNLKGSYHVILENIVNFLNLSKVMIFKFAKFKLIVQSTNFLVHGFKLCCCISHITAVFKKANM